MSVNVASSLDADLFSDEHVAYRESVRTFLARQVLPEYDGWTQAREIPRAVLRQSAEDGFLGMGVPERFGGLGVDDPRFGAVVASAAMEAGAPGLGLILALHNDVVVPALALHGRELLRERWLSGLASGDVVATLVEGELTIEDPGHGPVVSGTAAFVPNGAHADLFLVVGESGAVLIESSAPGVTVEASPEGIGLVAVGFADLEFSGAEAYALMPGALDFVGARRDLCTALTAAAGAREALALTVAYVRERKVFGVPLGSLENSRQVIAGMVGLTDSATALAEQCLRAAVTDTLSGARAAAGAGHCIAAYQQVVDHGVQLHGGYGYILEYPIARAYADAQFWHLQGNTEQKRREAVASKLLD